MARRRDPSSLDKTSGNLRAARERAGLFEIDAIADRRTHFTLRRALHFETTRNARLSRHGVANRGYGANMDVSPGRQRMRAWIGDCELT
jgi:hypothetical protein